MGQNLVLNVESRGFRCSVYNRTTSVTDEFIAENEGKNLYGAHTMEDFVESIAAPRKIMMLVQSKAGANPADRDAVDAVIEQLVPLLDKGDLIIDGGNTYFIHTERRSKELEEKGLLYIGTGVSGGEEGARKGPAIMPGGPASSWELIKPIFEAISAKVNGDPCVTHIGTGGAGHYVKMVHNGIEYGDMQLICEAYDLLRTAGYSYPEMCDIFTRWNKGVLNSYLVEITADILGFEDADGSYLLERILDAAGQKGTGKWAGVSALELGMPLTLITESVFSRCISALKEQRVRASLKLPGPVASESVDKVQFVVELEQALYAAKIISYAQGFMLLREASLANEWDLDYRAIALLWRGGCIIRSVFLQDIAAAYQGDRELENILFAPFFCDAMSKVQSGWRNSIVSAVKSGVPVPCLSAGLAFYDSFRRARLPANLVQAQRDYFGAHTYERTDQARGQFFHTDWTGRGGDIASSQYEV
jgi:6-phosphogluconate dehydrogenase